VQEGRQLLQLQQRAAAILQGKTQPTGAAESLQLAQFCHHFKRYPAAARLYAMALTAEPGLPEKLARDQRYKAACAAALAAAGQGKDADKLTGDDKAKPRQQALHWLRADLAAWAKQVETGKPQDRAEALRTLTHWQKDTDLAGVREPDALKNLPEAERAAWRQLWADVAALRKRAKEK
jgi:hypothetical protein